MSDWHLARVVSSRPDGHGLFQLSIDVLGTPIAEGHRSPGQYVKLKLEGVGEGFFAIASAPGDGHHFEFLIKSGSPLADALRALAPGAAVQLSAPGGKGFPLEKARGKDVLLFATGSGISALRPVIELIRRERPAFRNVTLFFGVRTPDAFGFASEHAQWEKAGIRLVRTVSQPGLSGWDGLTGYVQSHLEEAPLHDAIAFLVGQKAMVQAVTDALVQRGMPRENVFLNF